MLKMTPYIRHRSDFENRNRRAPRSIAKPPMSRFAPRPVELA